MHHPSRRRFSALLATGLFGPALPALAQGEAPLRIILPLSAGSGVDANIRAAQNALARELRQPVVVENLPGAGGITGTAALVKAAPDGKTIAFVSNNHAVNPSVFKKLPYDSLADITPISVVGEGIFALVANPRNLTANNAQELAAALRARPDGYNYASSGNGTIIHLAAEMFIQAAHAKARHIPYKGTGPMLNDLIAGQVDFGVASLASVHGHLKSGQLRAVAVMGDSRAASLPDVATMKEQGFADVVVGGWFAAIGPRGLPPAQVQRLQTGIAGAFNSPEVREALLKQETQVHPGTPEQAARFLRAEQARYAGIVRNADIRLD